MTQPEDVTLTLCGDVMLGRGVDQALAHPGKAELRETWVHDARDYLALAVSANGPVPRPLPPAWPWGEALPWLHRDGARVVLNLETSITQADDFAPGKAVHYRMHPANIGAVLAARPDVCVLANNHVMDFGTAGLRDSLAALGAAGLRTAGAGETQAQAWEPASVPLAGDRRLVVVALGHDSSGIPSGWAATAASPGVAYLAGFTDATAERALALVAECRRTGATVVVSVHWGSNWGHRIPADQVGFAHRLVDAGADLVHGHSSHHPRTAEVYRDRLVLHGCGDLVNDYEGIHGHDAYRGDLRLLHRATLAPTGRLLRLEMVPFSARRLGLWRAERGDAEWLATTLGRAGRPFGVGYDVTADGRLLLGW